MRRGLELRSSLPPLTYKGKKKYMLWSGLQVNISLAPGADSVDFPVLNEGWALRASRSKTKEGSLGMSYHRQEKGCCTF